MSLYRERAVTETAASLDSMEAKAVSQRDRAHRAKQILEDPLFVEAAEAIKATARKELEEAGLADDKGRQAAAAKLQGMNTIMDQLKRHMETGKIAETQLGYVEQCRRKLGEGLKKMRVA